MAKVASVQDVLDADHDDIIPSFRGVVIDIGDYKSGENDRGEWSLQTIKLEDNNGDVIKCVLKDREPLPKKYDECEIIIVAARGSKSGKLTGVYAKDDDFRGKEERILWVTGSAEITKGSDGGGGKEEGDEDDRRGRDRDDDRRERSSDDSEDDDAVNEVQDELAKLGNLYTLVYKEACRTGPICEQETNISMPPEQFTSMVHTMFIEANKRGIGDKLPEKPLFHLKATKPAAEPEAEQLPDERTASKKSRK